MITHSAELAPEEPEFSDSREIIMACFRDLGIEEHSLHPLIIERLTLIEDHYRRFNDDSRLIASGIDNLFAYFATTSDVPISISPEETKKTTIAALVHDIGKSGPAHATLEQQKAVVELFGVESVRDGTVLVGDVVTSSYPESAHEILSSLAACGVPATFTMRQFWNKHAFWTHDILETAPCSGIDQKIKEIAASHHIAEGINPYNIPRHQIPIGSLEIGTLEDYLDTLEKLSLIAIDKYEASMRRSHSSHSHAIAIVRKLVFEMFGDDQIMELILNGIDVLGKRGDLFAKKDVS